MNNIQPYYNKLYFKIIVFTSSIIVSMVIFSLAYFYRPPEAKIIGKWMRSDNSSNN